MSSFNAGLIKHCKFVLEAVPESPVNTSSEFYGDLNSKVDSLKNYIHSNATGLVEDLFRDKDFNKSYVDIKNGLNSLNFSSKADLFEEIESIQNQAALLRMDQTSFVQWLNSDQNEPEVQVSDFTNNPENILLAVENKKNSNPHFGPTLSQMVYKHLGFKQMSLDNLRNRFQDRKMKARALAHYVNVNHNVRLNDLGVKIEDLKLMAPHLHQVDCRGLVFKDESQFNEFINLCSNAYEIYVDSDKIIKLENLPKTLRRLDCTGCPNLEELSLSDLNYLNMVKCINCLKLEELKVSDSQQLIIITDYEKFMVQYPKLVYQRPDHLFY